MTQTTFWKFNLIARLKYSIKLMPWNPDKTEMVLARRMGSSYSPRVNTPLSRWHSILGQCAYNIVYVIIEIIYAYFLTI